MAFMLFGIAFIGGWVEQIGAMFQNETAVDVGILASLLLPTEILWKKATTLFSPDVGSGFQFAGPFMVISQPSSMMIIYSIIYVFALFGLAIFLFSRRDL
jgi:ABC-type transport system involved in multi-copper enzyme maturation permease subunit